MKVEHGFPTLKASGLSVVLLAWAACGVAQAEVHISTATELFPIPDMKDAARLVEIVGGTSVRPVSGAWEASVAQADEKTAGAVLAVRTGPLLGIQTMNLDGAEGLIAKWEAKDAGDKGVLSLWVYDTPDYNWFIVKCDPSSFSPVESIPAFLQQVLNWPFMWPLNLGLKFPLVKGTELFRGTAMLSQAWRGEGYGLVGLRLDSGCYLVIKLGKGQFPLGYPEGWAYVPERFPPLKDLVSGWSTERVLSEVGKTWDVNAAYANNNYRDTILIREAARRGLDGEALRRLLLPASAPSLIAWSQRVGSVTSALVEAQQLDANHDTLVEIAMSLGQRQDAGESASVHLFGALRDHSNFDDTKLALRCLTECLYPTGPLMYLAERGSDEATYARVAAAFVDDPVSRRWQGTALKNIRARIDQRKKEH